MTKTPGSYHPLSQLSQLLINININKINISECVCPRIDPLRFLAGCRRRRLNQSLLVALDFLSVLDRACFCVNFLVSGCMLCLVY